MTTNRGPHEERLQRILLAVSILEKYATKNKKLELTYYGDEYFGLTFQHKVPYKPVYPKISKKDKALLRKLGDFRVNKDTGGYEDWVLGTWVLWNNAD